jgi:hypothetical protein
MGWRLLAEVLDHAPDDLSWRERRTLEVLAFSALDEGQDARLVRGIEQNPRLKARLRLGRTERFGTLSELIRQGALERVSRGHKYVPATYRLPVFVSPMSHKNSVDGETRTLRPRNPDAEADLSVREIRTLRRRGPQRPDTTDAERGSFARFWNAYPRRVGRPAAAEAFSTALASGAGPDDLIGGAARFAASLNGVPPGKICRPSRWLSERWWLDYPAETKIDLPSRSQP